MSQEFKAGDRVVSLEDGGLGTISLYVNGDGNSKLTVRWDGYTYSLDNDTTLDGHNLLGEKVRYLTPLDKVLK